MLSVIQKRKKKPGLCCSLSDQHQSCQELQSLIFNMVVNIFSQTTGSELNGKLGIGVLGRLEHVPALHHSISGSLSWSAFDLCVTKIFTMKMLTCLYLSLMLTYFTSHQAETRAQTEFDSGFFKPKYHSNQILDLIGAVDSYS